MENIDIKRLDEVTIEHTPLYGYIDDGGKRNLVLYSKTCTVHDEMDYINPEFTTEFLELVKKVEIFQLNDLIQTKEFPCKDMLRVAIENANINKKSGFYVLEFIKGDSALVSYKFLT